MFLPAKSLAVISSIDPQDNLDKKYADTLCSGIYETEFCSCCACAFTDNQPSWAWSVSGVMIRMHIRCYAEWILKQEFEFKAACEMLAVLDAAQTTNVLD